MLFSSVSVRPQTRVMKPKIFLAILMVFMAVQAIFQFGSWMGVSVRCFHSNLIQGLFATLVGIILGYLAVEYLIKWAILLHIINNFVFSTLLGLATSSLPPDLQQLVINVIILIFFIGGVIIMCLKRSSVRPYLEENRAAEAVKLIQPMQSARVQKQTQQVHQYENMTKMKFNSGVTGAKFEDGWLRVRFC